MPVYDERSAECLVFTEKEGLLARVAHDLTLRVSRFSIRVSEDEGAIEARFDARSLRVVCATQGGAEQRGALSESDKKKIEESIESDVLRPSKWPEIRFVSTKVEKTGRVYRIGGRLTLAGRDQLIALTTSEEGDRRVAEITLHQPDFGIKPFSAMLGALKIKPHVRVRVSVPRGDA